MRSGRIAPQARNERNRSQVVETTLLDDLLALSPDGLFALAEPSSRTPVPWTNTKNGMGPSDTFRISAGKVPNLLQVSLQRTRPVRMVDDHDATRDRVVVEPNSKLNGQRCIQRPYPERRQDEVGNPMPRRHRRGRQETDVQRRVERTRESCAIDDWTAD